MSEVELTKHSAVSHESKDYSCCRGQTAGSKQRLEMESKKLTVSTQQLVATLTAQNYGHAVLTRFPHQQPVGNV
jgi:hypothetical protein